MPHNFTTILDQAEKTWIPTWFQNFSDVENDGFYERLDVNYNNIEMPKRLLSQCRQIIVYSMAYKNTPRSEYLSKIDDTFDFIDKNYFQPKVGGAIFSIDQRSNDIVDNKYDLYAHAFVLMACSAYLSINSNYKIERFAKTILNFVLNNFRNEYGGFNEALDKKLTPIKKVRRQNPHMHLLESTLHLYEITGDKEYLDTAQELLTLFFEKFYDKKTQTIGEFFNNDLSPHVDTGNIVETGHHAEWIWLLKRYQEITQSEDTHVHNTINSLFDWILRNGFNKGIYNSQSREGNVLESDKRIWPVMETMRAAAIMTQNNLYQNEALSLLEDLKKIFLEKYINFETGAWNEILDKDLSLISDYLPATTPYHIYPILVDIKKYLNQN